MVYVISKQGNPLMPCTESKARKLLRSDKARCIRRVPFTITLLFDCEENVQEVIAGMDTGSKTIGCACVSNGKVLYQSEVQVRQDVSKKMEQRRMYRRNRRIRKTRYRKARFLNRSNSFRKDRLAPSIKSKVDSHLREKRFVESILPVTKWKIETASFDIHKISNPVVTKWGSRSEKKIPTGKLFGIRKFDCIQTNTGVGFVKGKRSSGYFSIMDIFGNIIHSSVNIKKDVKRLQARKSIIKEVVAIPPVPEGTGFLVTV